MTGSLVRHHLESLVMKRARTPSGRIEIGTTKQILANHMFKNTSLAANIAQLRPNWSLPTYTINRIA